MADPLANKLLRYPGAVARRFRSAWLSTLGVRMGKNCWIAAVEIPRNPWDVRLGDAVALDRGVVLLTTGDRRAPDKPRININSRCYINRFTIFDASERIEVGTDCMIGPFCYITDHDHGFARGQPVHRQPLVGAPVRIGNDVWIGAGVCIVKGVTVGDGAVIGAGAVVTKNVEPYTKVAGVPARSIGMRI